MDLISPQAMFEVSEWAVDTLADDLIDQTFKGVTLGVFSLQISAKPLRYFRNIDKNYCEMRVFPLTDVMRLNLFFSSRDKS